MKNIFSSFAETVKREIENTLTATRSMVGEDITVLFITSSPEPGKVSTTNPIDQTGK